MGHHEFEKALLIKVAKNLNKAAIRSLPDALSCVGVVIRGWENKNGNTSALLSHSEREEGLCCGSHRGVMMPVVREKQHQWHCMLQRWEWNVSQGLSFKGGGLSRSGGGWKDNIAGAEKVDDLLFFSEWPHKYSPYKLTHSRCICFSLFCDPVT